MARCRTRIPVKSIPVAAGERIVAFAQPGKPPGIRFLRAGGPPPVPGKPP
jgi:hypothetical protein